MRENLLSGPFWDLIDQNAPYEDVEKALIGLCAPYGAEVISCVEIHSPASDATPFIGRLIGKRDGEYLRRYRRLELDRHDVVLLNVPRATGGFSWDDVKHLAKTREQQDVFSIAREHWLSDGFLSPFFGAGGRIGFTGFYGMKIDDDPVTRRLFEFVGNKFYQYAILKAQEARSGQIAAVQLTARQIDVLYWISKGKTDAEMSYLLDIAKPTVNRHVEMAKERIGVRSRAEAVHYALVNQLISPI